MPLQPSPFCIPPLLRAQSIIIDNGAPEYSEAGTWTLGSSAAGRYGADYRFILTTGDSAAPPAATATWRPNLPTAGYYYVFTQYPQGSNRSPDAPFTIAGDQGTSVVRINQQTNGGSFYYLGQMHFAAGTEGTLMLGNNAQPNVVIADARALRLRWPNPGARTSSPGSAARPHQRPRSSRDVD